ncbi:MAG: endonuclease/exonuclease/phosphatase family protein [Gammaproteobacteria bacterium]|nr:endonuclease/exonuclease/phosphatase family protein [Gammaproteobacteria bacterium]
MKKQRLNRGYSGGGPLCRVFAIAVLLQLSACAQRPVMPDASAAVQVSTGVRECRDLLGGNSTVGAELDASNIRILNWNVRKTRAPRWRDDFDAYENGADLVLFQEASIREETIAEMDSSRHWSFAPGYSKRGEITGVMTLSGVKPLTQCSFMHAEPWLRTPKATSITEYGLTDTDQTLVVANVHAVNFSWRTGAFERQFEEIRQVLENHDGPIILSGDMNTWRARRTQIVSDLATSLQLIAIEFERDHRVRFLGSALDHIYVRGLQTLDASTTVVETSDHNPMTAVLGM